MGGLFEAASGGIVSGQTCGERREEVEVERVALVMHRTLDVTPVGQYLAINFVQQHPPAGVHPSLARGELRQRRSGHVEGERLAGEMCVGAEVVGEMSLDVRQLSIES